MQAKAELMGRKTAMTDDEVFRLSMIVLNTTYSLQTEPIVEPWSWFFRDFVQSHALVKVVSELCKGTSSSVHYNNINEAWHFVEKILQRIPPIRRRDPEVSPIITLMALARRSRVGSYAGQAGEEHSHPAQVALYTPQETPMDSHNVIGSLQAFPDAWAENAVLWSDKFLTAAITTPESIIGGGSAVQSPEVSSRSASVGNLMMSQADSRWSIEDLPLVDPNMSNVDWSQWNDSLDVFDTKFGPA